MYNNCILGAIHLILHLVSRAKYLGYNRKLRKRGTDFMISNSWYVNYFPMEFRL